MSTEQSPWPTSGSPTSVGSRKPNVRSFPAVGRGRGTRRAVRGLDAAVEQAGGGRGAIAHM